MALSDNLVGYYKIDETSGTTLVNEIGDDGDINSATINQTGILGKCQSFGSGTSDMVDHGVTYNGNWSFNFWAYFTSLGSYFRWISMRDDALWFLSWNEIFATSKLEIGFAGAGAYAIEALATGAWTMFTLTSDGTNLKLYKNGNSTPIWSQAMTAPSPDSINEFGSLNNSGSPSYKIDELGIWSRCLGTDEIATLYNSGSGLAYPFPTEGTNCQINISDSWKEIDNMKINISDAWKEVSEAKINIGDTWKTIY